MKELIKDYNSNRKEIGVLIESKKLSVGDIRSIHTMIKTADAAYQLQGNKEAIRMANEALIKIIDMHEAYDETESMLETDDPHGKNWE